MLIYSHLEEYLSSELSRAEASIVIYCPFVKVSVLDRILSDVSDSVKLTLITTWKEKNFLSGSCDSEIYPFCIKRGITLLKNNRIHMKVWLIDQSRIICGSANISEKALVDSPGKNLELLVPTQNAEERDLEELSHIFETSKKVTVDDYNSVKDIMPDVAFEQGTTVIADSQFFVSIKDLPKSPSVKHLWVKYIDKSQDKEALHDFRLFDLPVGLTEHSFLKILKKEILNKPLVQELTQLLRESEMYWGDVKRWLKHILPKTEVENNNLDLVIDILYNWLPAVNPDFRVHQPNHSEQINYESRLSLHRGPVLKDVRDKIKQHKRSWGS